MKFLDQAKIYISSGHGGGGCIAFRREKFVAFGGPNGGDGGRGGHVYIEGTADLNTLIDFRYKQHFKAKTGTPGMGSDMTGAAGEDMIIRVPIGTQIIDADSEDMLIDISEDGQRVLLARGGNGGWGNARFKTATNQAPRRANPGEDGEERWVWLRLKLIADAGLVGLPNAGKSTFLSAVSAAKPKTAAYPFTTLRPHLGVVDYAETARFVLADIPGLIEGASEGAGIGTRFLGHIERCAALVHLVDVTGKDPVEAYKIIRGELAAYENGLSEKPEILALNKIDAVDADTLKKVSKAIKKASGKTPLHVSGVSGEGVRDVLGEVFKLVDARRAAEKKEGEPEAESWSP
ncbi:GTPase ObgE [Robiginitomaculum antarcticum]|uniref:GTPase ObgE n=1 Tax=Robiginitomaculum antarcticum TaxID=437507 RepID=UPI0003676DD8|nr:GTPase ObgE [Robiginitomaculum antarcticum]